ncbi:MAG: FAD-dependent monooxygenase [Gammaproteobacteria bacterium]|nr:FAD-dependent monooxygenase [Gammaproteobacteria bacterium]
MPPDYDAIVVGAGLVGSCAALALHREGRRVLLLDQGPAPRAPDGDARALVLSAASIEILRGLGLWSRLEAHATAIRHIRVSDRGGPGALALDARDSGLDAMGWACPADILLYELRVAMADALGEHVCWDSRYLGHRAGDDAIEIEVAQGDTVRMLHAALLIGADGNASPVRVAAGIATDGYDYGQHALIARVEVTRPQPHTAFEHFTREGPLAMIPCGGARYVSVQCLHEGRALAALRLDDDAYGAELARRFGTRLGHITVAGPRRAHALARQRARRLTDTRLVLIGNAANTMHPNAAQGLNLGLRDVATLAACIGAEDDAGLAATLSRYAAARAPDQRNTVGFSDLLAQGFRSRLCAVSATRRLALTLADLCPGAKQRFVQEASGLAALARSTAAVRP